MPLFLLGAVIGAVRVGTWARRLIGGVAAANLAPGLLGMLLVFGMASTLVFAVHYGDNSSDIHRMQMTMARVIDERLPADALVAINDAGILRYLSNRRTLDLVGLTSPGMARIWREGSGSLIEYFERQPETARPTHFAIFPNWFQLEESGVLEPVHAVVLQTPSIVDAEKMLYVADWRGLRRSPEPCNAAVLPPGHRVVDQVDVADLEDEARHEWRAWHRERGTELRTVAARGMCRAAAADSAAFADGGRVLMGGATMRVQVHRGRDVAIILRTRGGLRQRFQVRWNGAPVAAPDFRGPDGEWVEQLVARVPASLVTSADAEIRLESATWDGARRPLLAFHIWITQPR
jgi:hypothetical protein